MPKIERQLKRPIHYPAWVKLLKGTAPCLTNGGCNTTPAARHRQSITMLCANICRRRLAYDYAFCFIPAYRESDFVCLVTQKLLEELKSYMYRLNIVRDQNFVLSKVDSLTSSLFDFLKKLHFGTGKKIQHFVGSYMYTVRMYSPKSTLLFTGQQCGWQSITFRRHPN